MPGITMLTALEIFSNPRDLVVSTGRVEGKYAIAISRGPGHNFKILIDSQPFAETPEAATKAIHEILGSIREAATKQLGDRESIPSQYLNPSGRRLHQSKVLDADLIDWILNELREGRVARTYQKESSAPEANEPRELKEEILDEVCSHKWLKPSTIQKRLGRRFKVMDIRAAINELINEKKIVLTSTRKLAAPR